MKVDKTKQIAEKYKEILKPYCERIKIAGSIRREKSEVEDIEIICTAKIITEPDFYDDDKNKIGTCYNALEEFLARQSWKFLIDEPKYKQFLLPEKIKLFLSIVNKNNFEKEVYDEKRNN